ncbi:hypothetical protein GOZ83_19805 [Agrobacterium vitis]|uniref:hypothetical protein n=1 Tax=Agrobacterium vitis TaxID=373 RepID=UPI0012E7F1C0|nr:hypothetical protein [Agrobacterium vitis]MVA47304.1 hypothetical protein [Agrobacterium vitis]
MRVGSIFTAIALFVSMPFAAIGGMLQDADLHELNNFSEPERAFFIKTTENLLSDKIAKIMADPENKSDGYLWARKYIAQSYTLLSEDARDLSLYELSGIYKDEAKIITAHINGQLKTKEISAKEQPLTWQKSQYFEKMISLSSDKTMADPKHIEMFSKNLFDRIDYFSAYHASDENGNKGTPHL